MGVALSFPFGDPGLVVFVRFRGVAGGTEANKIVGRIRAALGDSFFVIGIPCVGPIGFNHNPTADTVKH
jgi:hypothetical protein